MHNVGRVDDDVDAVIVSVGPDRGVWDFTPGDIWWDDEQPDPIVPPKDDGLPQPAPVEDAGWEPIHTDPAEPLEPAPGVSIDLQCDMARRNLDSYRQGRAHAMNFLQVHRGNAAMLQVIISFIQETNGKIQRLTPFVNKYCQPPDKDAKLAV